MFKIKRHAIIGLLVVLLVFTGYLNHQLTQQAQLKASKDYKNHELGKLAEMEVQDENITVATKDELDIIESASLDEVEGNTLETMADEASNSSESYFVDYRLSRDKLRGTLVERLDQIVNNSNTKEESRIEAQKEIMRIGSISEKELQIEGLVKGKGYEDVLVFLTEKDIRVVVSSSDLQEQDMVKILDIVKSETEYTMDNIKIMKKQ